MRDRYRESASRFVFGLVFFGAMVWSVAGRTGGGMTGLQPALGAAGATVGLATLYALPVAVLLSVPAGLRPGQALDRLLQGVTVVLAGVSTVVVLVVAGGFLPDIAREPLRELLAVLTVAPWLSRAIRDGMDMSGRGGLLRACTGRILQEFGNLLVVTAPLQSLFAPRVADFGLPARILSIVLPALIAHLAGDLLTSGMKRREARLSTSWLVLGGLMVAAFLTATVVQVDAALRVALVVELAVGVRVSLLIALGAAAVAAVAGALVAVIGRAIGPGAAAMLAPRVSFPGLVAVGLSGLCLMLFTGHSGPPWVALFLGLAFVPNTAYAFRRLLANPGPATFRGLLGALLLVIAQALFGEAMLGVIGLGVQPPSVSLGSLVSLKILYQSPSPHGFAPATILMLGIGGLFLVGQALRDSDRTDA